MGTRDPLNFWLPADRQQGFLGEVSPQPQPSRGLSTSEKISIAGIVLTGIGLVLQIYQLGKQ